MGYSQASYPGAVTMEAEYMAACDASNESIWLRRLFSSLGVQHANPTDLHLHDASALAATSLVIHGDNAAAIALAHNDVHHARSKHIDIRHHAIRGHIDQGALIFQWIPSKANVSDLLTKPLPRPLFLSHRSALMGLPLPPV